MPALPTPRKAIALGLLALTVACGDSTGPASAKLDTNSTLADYQALRQMFASEGFAGVQALGGRSSLAGSPAIVAMRALPGLADGSTSRQYALDLFRAATAARGEGTFAKTVISNRHLGKTLVYDAALNTWVIDAARTGAPTTGVRFIVYEQAATGKPIPSKEIGRADLIDEGVASGNVIALRLLVVTHNATTLDYRTKVDITTTGGSIDVTGFAAEGEKRFDFTIGLKGRGTGANTVLDADFDFAVKPRNFSVTGSVRGVQDSKPGEGTVTLTAKHQENTLKVAVTGTNGTLDGTITWNSKTFVTITGPVASPVIKGATGEPITPAEGEVVQHVMKFSEDVFTVVEKTVAPVQDIVLLGWIL